MNPLIFSVEDDKNIQNVINIALKNSNFEIRSFNNADEMFSALQDFKPAAILLDIMLPKISGLDILKKLKSNKETKAIPVMIVSAKISEVDKVIGLDLGADDYLIKPFGVLELVSRVKALLRRSSANEENDEINIEGLIIDQKKHLCTYKENEIKLTVKQFELLFLLMQNRNITISRDEIFNKIWDFDFVGETRTVDVHIKEIRKKLNNAGIDGKVIEAVRGVGYRFIL